MRKQFGSQSHSHTSAHREGSRRAHQTYAQTDTHPKCWHMKFHPQPHTGFGKTPKLPYMDDNARADVVLAAANFGLKGNSVPLILVSPSMSGCVPATVASIARSFSFSLSLFLSHFPLVVNSTLANQYTFTHACRKWAMSFIDRHGTNLAAWVAIAPVGLSSWPGPSATVHRQVR